MFIKGKNLIFYIYINGQPYALYHARTCEINTTAAILPTTTYLSGKGQTNEYAGKYSYTIKGEGLNYIGDKATNFALQGLQTTFSKINWTFTDNANVQWQGVALIVDTKFDSGFDGVSTFSNELLGDGEYTFTQANIPPSPPVGNVVNIFDQFGTLITSIVAPGSYNVTKFNAIDCGSANQSTPLIIITA